MDKKQPWTLEAIFVLLYAVPVYLSGYFNDNLTIAFWFHLGLVALYALIIATFGRGSSLEFGCLPLIIAVMFAILSPVFKAAKTKAEQQRQKQAIIAPSPQSLRR